MTFTKKILVTLLTATLSLPVMAQKEINFKGFTLQIPDGFTESEPVWGDIAYYCGNELSIDLKYDQKGDDDGYGTVISSKQDVIRKMDMYLARGASEDYGEGKIYTLGDAVLKLFDRACLMTTGSDNKWCSFYIFFSDRNREKALEIINNLAKTTTFGPSTFKKQSLTEVMSQFQKDKVNLMDSRLKERLIMLVGERNFYYMNAMLVLQTVQTDDINIMTGEKVKTKPENYIIQGMDMENGNSFTMIYNIMFDKLEVAINFCNGNKKEFQE